MLSPLVHLIRQSLIRCLFSHGLADARRRGLRIQKSREGRWEQERRRGADGPPGRRGRVFSPRARPVSIAQTPIPHPSRGRRSGAGLAPARARKQRTGRGPARGGEAPRLINDSPVCGNLSKFAISRSFFPVERGYLPPHAQVERSPRAVYQRGGRTQRLNRRK